MVYQYAGIWHHLAGERLDTSDNLQSGSDLHQIRRGWRQRIELPTAVKFIVIMNVIYCGVENSITTTVSTIIIIIIDNKITHLHQ